MSFTPELINEMDALLLFDLDAAGHQGIKVHKNASEDMIQAVRRLHAKELITLPDGGYLTNLGRQAATNLRATLDILTAGKAALVQ